MRLCDMMELFVVDVFDCQSLSVIGSALEACFSESCSFEVGRLMSEPVFQAQIVFRAIWRALLGVGAAKNDFAWFIMAYGHPLQINDHTNLVRGAITFTLQNTALKCVPISEDRVKRAVDAANKALANMIDKRDEGVRSALVLKWIDRFWRRGVHNHDKGVITKLMKMQPMNAYANIIEMSSTDLDNNQVHTPKTYYANTWRHIQNDKLLQKNVMTGMSLTGQYINKVSELWSINEAVRHVFTRDTHFMRTTHNKMMILVRDLEIMHQYDGIIAQDIIEIDPKNSMMMVGNDAYYAVSNMGTMAFRLTLCIGGNDYNDYNDDNDGNDDDGDDFWDGNVITMRTTTGTMNIPSHIANNRRNSVCITEQWTNMPFVIGGSLILPRYVDNDVEPPWLPMLRRRIMQKQCESSCQDGELLFYEFLARYAVSKLLPNERFNVARRSDKAIVVVDSRENVLTALSALIALANVQASTTWSMYVFCTPEAVEFYKRMMHVSLVDVDAINFVCLPLMKPMLGTFDRDAYNAMLKSHEFWSAIDAKEVLTVQDDGFLLRKGVEERFMDKYDYVGAPWRACSENDDLLKLANTELVGNGGVSLRNVTAMLDVCQQDPEGHRARSLFFGDTQPIPEDVYFAGGVRNGRLCPRSEALEFSVEQVECLSSLCVHRFWMYNSVQYVYQHCATILNNQA